VRRAIAPGEYQYGWIRIAVTGSSAGPPTPALCEVPNYRTVWIYDSAFELTPNTPIIAGDKGCVADCDASGTLSIDDFICYQTLYALQAPAADCDVSGDL